MIVIKSRGIGFNLKDVHGRGAVDHKFIRSTGLAGKSSFLPYISRLREQRVGEQIGMIDVIVPADSNFRCYIPPGAFFDAAYLGMKRIPLAFDVRLDISEPGR